MGMLRLPLMVLGSAGDVPAKRQTIIQLLAGEQMVDGIGRVGVGGHSYVLCAADNGGGGKVALRPLRVGKESLW